MDWSEVWLDFLPVLTLHLYALSTILVLAGILARQNLLKNLAFGVMLVAGFLLLLGLGTSWLETDNLNRAFFLQIFSLALSLVAMVIWKRWPALLLIVLPCALLTLLMAILLRHAQIPLTPSLPKMSFSIHILAIFASLGFICLGFGAGILFLILERSLKAKTRLAKFHKDLPSLSALDKINAWSVKLGFPLFSLGLLFGFISARLAYGNIQLADPKEFISLCILVLYAWLFRARCQGWQGHKPAVWAIAIFGLCLGSLLGVNFFLPTHHSFVI